MTERIIVFEFLNSGNKNLYHTNGKTLIGPHISYNYKHDMPENTINISYLVFIDPDNDLKCWYQKIGHFEFKNTKYFEDGLADIELEFDQIYSHITKEIPYEKFITPHLNYDKFITYPSLSDISRSLSSWKTS